ncbi:hypothetical protein AMR72_00185 [Flavobacterium psychrophilum]|nr:hypothetical protein AMR72_00185 [Flavobacterium psychrophilum]AOE51069.1 hypothetical protein ALW18_00185 [Flavobacterium psychrophilum]
MPLEQLINATLGLSGFYFKPTNKNKTMKKILFSMMTVVLTLSSCSNDDDNKQTVAQGLEDTWSLSNVSGGGWTDVNHNFNDNAITWTFKGDGTVVVNNNNQDDTVYDGFESGTYNYLVTVESESSQCKESMKVDDSKLGCYSIDTTGKLVLDLRYVDGHKLTFVKSN